MGAPAPANLRLAVQQRVLPDYRTAFFEVLAGYCPAGLSVFAGEALPVEGIGGGAHLQVAERAAALNRHLGNPASLFYLCWQRGILAWLERWQPDVLVVEANPRLLSTPRAVRWMHSRGRPVLGWGLGAPPLRGKLSVLRRWERTRFLNTLDGWIAYSQRGAREYCRLGLDPERVFWAGNAAAPRPVSPPPSRADAFHAAPLVLFVGRLQRRKRIDHLLQACASLPSGLQPRLVIVGDGPDRAALEDLARQVYPAAEFPGARRGRELEPYFRSADLFILPGTGGLAVQQAMAHALPVIVAQGDGTQDDLVRPENGWLLPQDDLPALTAALREALGDPHRLRRMGLASYRIVAEEINLERMAERFMHAIHTVLALYRRPQ
jgi:glycosyltransferase involved in cell wall biosynthesis